MSASELLKLLLVFMFILLCLFPHIDADNRCASCQDGVTSEHCSRCKRFCSPLMNGCYYKRDGSSRLEDNKRLPQLMFDRIAESVNANLPQRVLTSPRSQQIARSHTSTSTERCAVENLITTLPDNWQKDILEVVRWAIVAKKEGKLPSKTAELSGYLLNFIEMEDSITTLNF